MLYPIDFMVEREDGEPDGRTITISNLARVHWKTGVAIAALFTGERSSLKSITNWLARDG
jgi:hypothetical protein